MRIRCHGLIRHLLAPVCAIAAAAAPALAQPAPDVSIPYATIGGRQAFVYLWRPVGTGPWPVLVFIHGGGWSGGSPLPFPGVTAPLLQQGIAVASVQYRLTSQAGQWGAEPVTWPAQINDVKAAIRRLRADAPVLGIDPRRIGTWGTSAGGHLSAMCATSGGEASLEGTVGGALAFSSRVQCAVDYFGPADLLQMNADVTTPPGSGIDHDALESPESRLLGSATTGISVGQIRDNASNPAAPWPALHALAQSAGPANLVTTDDPPLFIGHGMQDTSVPLNQSTRLAAAATAAGVWNDYRQVPGAGHGALGAETDAAARAFLVRMLRCPGPGDWNHDGVATPTDIAVYVNTWFDSVSNATSAAEVDGIEGVTPADLAAFINLWITAARGC
ncbi:MAG: alpha/beta hydrolase [Phycisphaeraceae bacterium]|nr:alpha/beta hydrolase [Phycisphaeraceae bacterium]